MTSERTQLLRADQEPVFTSINTERMGSLFRELMAITNRPPPAYEPKASALLLLILAELFASRASKVSFAEVGKGRPLSDTVRKGIDCITRFYDQSASIKQIAGAVGTSMFHFSRVFRRETGCTPIEYLNRYRIEQARRLLLESDKSVEEIGRSVGIRVPNYFAKIFQRYTGMTPRQYREKKPGR
jgi:AraC-like DNA-binding protein